MEHDGPTEEEAPDPQVVALIAESNALRPFLNSWLLSKRVGEFIVERTADGGLAVYATISDATDSHAVPYIVPGN